jgi:hypothetical protein
MTARLDKKRPQPGPVSAAHIENIKVLLKQGHTSAQIGLKLHMSSSRVAQLMRLGGLPPTRRMNSRANALDPYRVVEQAISGMSGLAQGVSMLRGTPWSNISAEQAKVLIHDANDALRTMYWMVRQLKEISRGPKLTERQDGVGEAQQAFGDPGGPAGEDASGDQRPAGAETLSGGRAAVEVRHRHAWLPGGEPSA